MRRVNTLIMVCVCGTGGAKEAASVLEHFADETLLGNSQKEVFRELADPLIPRRRFKRKLPDHLRRQRQFSRLFFSVVAHPNAERSGVDLRDTGRCSEWQ